MKIGILSDIHGNLEALEAVNSDLRNQDISTVYCLGDMVGYGPDSELVLQRVQDYQYNCCLGNHEFALLDERGRRWFNFQARENNVLIEKMLSGKSIEFCKSLPAFMQFEDMYCIHGFPMHSIFRYLHRQKDSTVQKLFQKSEYRLFFVGHTHRLQLILEKEGHIHRQSPVGKISLGPVGKIVCNVGSVGQPRDGTNFAKYVVWDMETDELEIRAVDYDRETTIKKILDLGFPENYGLRLR